MDDPDLYHEWRALVNMTPAALRRFLMDWGGVAGLSRAEASAQGVKSGRESATWILRMKATPVRDWTPTMWAWAKRQVAFIKRMRGAQGALVKEDGTPTRKLLALLVWGHDPTK
jgi:hypothetical protein